MYLQMGILTSSARLTAGQFAIYGDIKKFLGEWQLKCWFKVFADRVRCDWWGGDCEVRKRLLHQHFGTFPTCMPGYAIQGVMISERTGLVDSECLFLVS